MADKSPSEDQEAILAPQSRAEFIKNDAGKMLKDDVIGVSDWRRSKLGALTGFSIIRRAASSVGTNMQESSDRLAGLLGAVTAPEILEDAPQEGSGRERFAETARFYGLRETELSAALRNTFWSTWLYLVATVAYVCVMLWSYYAWPAQNVIAVIARMGPLPFGLAMLFKHAFTNWIIRNRSLGDGALAFLKSGDYLPKK